MSDQQRSNAVRRHYYETLARRAQTQPEPVRRALDEKLARALAIQRPRIERNEASLERKGYSSPLSDLLRHIAQQTAQVVTVDSASNEDDRADLKSLRYFRDSWSKLSIDHSVAEALATGPSNAGPLNSHSLIVQSLKLLRDIAPEYLNRFMSYADALLWLEQASIDSTPPKKATGRGEGNKKRKSRPS